MDNSNQKPVSEILTAREIRRYSLQIGSSSIGITGQEKIKKAKVLVVGAGGKGSSLLQILTSLGVGVIGISDDFPVQESDLSRQHLYGNGDLGKQKAIVARQKLMQINHFVDFKLHNVCLSEKNILAICQQYEIFIDATDNFSAHYLLNDASVKLNRPMIYGNLIYSKCVVSVFNYQGGPSFRCAYPTPVEAEQAAENVAFACQTVALNIVGSLMANEVVKVILGMETQLSGNLLAFDLKNNTLAYSKVKRSQSNFKIA